jgi:protein-S-isoprenylcysteine O-methyltransferase Ste14
MAILFRALVYATVFVGFVLVFLPARLLEWSGVATVSNLGFPQVVGMVVVLVGGVVVAWCVLTFVVIGRGTPAPFDPPRTLVIRGPYRYVRNPMYLGAGVALSGAAVYYGSLPMLAYVIAFLLLAHAFVRTHEEPALQRRFGSEYEQYRSSVGRWIPRRLRPTLGKP